MGKLNALKKNDTELGQFIDNCIELLKYGTINTRLKKSVYKDEHIEIEHNKTNKEFTITIFYLSGDGHEMSNPVVMIVDNDDVIRTHGEWIYKKEYVNGLLKRLSLYQKLNDDRQDINVDIDNLEKEDRKVLKKI